MLRQYAFKFSSVTGDDVIGSAYLGQLAVDKSEIDQWRNTVESKLAAVVYSIVRARKSGRTFSSQKLLIFANKKTFRATKTASKTCILFEDLGKEYKGVHTLKTPTQAPDVHVSEMPSDDEENEAAEDE